MSDSWHNGNKWDSDNVWDSLLREYDQAVGAISSLLAWYEQKRKWKRIWSKSLRAGAIMSAAAGTFCPLIDATGVLKSGGDVLILGQFGYVAFALAGALVGADKFFGVSSGWMRFTLTRMEIERRLKSFRLDWNIYLADIEGQPHTSQDIKALLGKIKELTLSVHDTVKRETEYWASEFRTNLTELEKVVRAEAETTKPGDISVSLTNAAEFGNEFTLSFPGRGDEIIRGSSALLSGVPPGNYPVRVTGQKGERTSTDVRVVDVQAGRLERVTFQLP